MLPLLLPLLLASLTFLSLLLALLTLPLPLLLPLPLILPLLLPVPSRGFFIQTPAQRIKIIRQLSRAIEVLLRSRTIRAARTLFRRLQAFGKVVETAFNRTLVVAAAALLTLLLAAIQRLLTFTNSIRDAIARQRISRILQLSCGTLLALTAAAHRTCGLFDVLLQIVNSVGQRVFPFRQLFARLLRVLILRVLTTAAREVLHVFRDFALSRSRLRCALAQIGDLLLPSCRS